MQISAPPPSHRGRTPLSPAPKRQSSRLKTKTARSPCRTIFLALFSSPAPIRWAICTVKPMLAAEQSPPISQVLEETSPIDAESFAPSCPTMEASIYCMTMEEIWAIMAGMLN